MQLTAIRFLVIAVVSVLCGPAAAVDDLAWVDAMRNVHAGSLGEKGVLVHLGDSITYSMAYFAPLQYLQNAKLPPDVRRALDLVDAYINKDCYRWKGRDKGNYSGETAAWGLANIDQWLAELKPEVALIMFGTNDIRRGAPETHAEDLRMLARKCLDRGVVVILSTIPPMHGHDEKVRQTVNLQRKVAADLKVPLIDFYAHIVNRRPSDWDGALPQFGSFGQWDVPTIISRDGVHPSNPKAWQGDYTEEGLCRNGNTLRTYLALMAYAEVIDVVMHGRAPGIVSRTILGPAPAIPGNVRKTDVLKPALPSPGDTRLIIPPVQNWFPKAPSLPPPSGETIAVKTVRELYSAVDRVKPGGTILVTDGFYSMPQTLYLHTDNVTLRGRSGDRTRVVLDFSASRHHEGVTLRSCSGVTIADLAVANVRQNGIKINSDLGVDRVTIHNVLSHNVWQRHIKGPKVPDENGGPAFVEACRVQYCLFYNDRPKQHGDDPWEDSNGSMGFNYVGGLDIMCARGWVISDNVFIGIRGKSGEARGAIFMWHNSTDCLIERNIIIDCDAGICLGNSSARGERRHANGVLVRNNFVVRCNESNILADHTRNCRILSNTVHDPATRTGRLLRVVHANDGLVVANNIFSGPRIVTEYHDGKIDLRNNLIRPVGDYFVDAAQGNLHLTIKAVDAIDRATGNRDTPGDIDRQPRGPKPDLGADEWVPAAQ